MHYYQFNIGDYTAHTARLSPMEDLIYRRLIDLYYLNEHPFNECSKSVAREIGLVEFSLDVEFILGKFFYLEDGLWKQNRAEREIAKYHSNKKSASKAGKASAKARKLKASEQTLNDRTQSVEPNIKQETLNTKHKTIKVPYQLIVDVYREVLPELPEMKLLTDKRKRMIKRLFNDDPKHKHIEWWKDYFNYIRGSDHLMNRIERAPPHQGWSCDLPWLIDMNNFAKIIDGKYHR